MELIRGLKRINSFKLLEHLLEQTEQPADVYIASYSITEEWIQRIIRIKSKRPIKSITAILDRDVIIRHPEKLVMLKRVFDVIMLSDSHAKMYMVCSSDFEGAVLTSANATNNYRIETSYETRDPNDIKIIKSDIESISGRAKIIIGNTAD